MNFLLSSPEVMGLESTCPRALVADHAMKVSQHFTGGVVRVPPFEHRNKDVLSYIAFYNELEEA